MKIFVLSLVISVLAVLLAACDSVSAEEDVSIPLGTYEAFGVRTVLNDSIYSEGLSGVYFQRVLDFKAEHILVITVHSDYEPEAGIARGMWRTDGATLHVIIDESSSSYYEAGQEIYYERIEVVDDQYHTVFGIEEHTFIFNGPGLILIHESTDLNDIDKDGDTDELLKDQCYFELNVSTN